LSGEVAAVAGKALIDGVVAAACARTDHSGRWGSRVGVAGAPGGLAAGRGAVALPADRGERGAADGTGPGRGGRVVVTVVVTRRWHRRARRWSG
jgi:hypothetical protein